MSLIEEPIITPQTESGVSRVNAEAFVFDFAIHINSLQKLDASLLSAPDNNGYPGQSRATTISHPWCAVRLTPCIAFLLLLCYNY